MQTQAAPLAHRPLHQAPAGDERVTALLNRFRAVLVEQGMASIDEYGDMLKWALPSRDGWCRYFHAYDPSFCSFRDVHRGTVHFHGGEIRGTVLLGAMDHHTYETHMEPQGDRTYAGARYRLKRHTHHQPEGTSYRLPAFVPHWPVPTQLTVTYFEEEDNSVMGDLLEPVVGDHDDHVWTQGQADALLPRLLGAIDARVAASAP